MGVAARADRCNANHDLDWDGWHEVTEAGLWRLGIPEEDGGSGGSLWDFVAAYEGLASTADDIGFLLSILPQASAVRAIHDNGGVEQRRKFLPALMAGTPAATAATEPHGGSDVARTRTIARSHAGRLVLSGHKSHITNAPIAQLFIILGRMDGLPPTADITLYVVERGLAGLSTGDREHALGIASSPTGDIAMLDCRLDAVNVLGAAGTALPRLYEMLTFDRACFAALAGAFPERLLQRAWDRTRQRTSFGVALLEHQRVQDLLVAIKIRQETARALAHRALWVLEQRAPEASQLASVAKLVAIEGLAETARDYLHLHGHQGYLSTPIGRFVRDAIGLRIAGGTSEMQRMNIFKRMHREISKAGASC